MSEPTNQHSRGIRAKFTEEDVDLATGRAERFLALRYPEVPASEIGYLYSLLTALLADYDLSMLDEMFGASDAQ